MLTALEITLLFFGLVCIVSARGRGNVGTAGADDSAIYWTATLALAVTMGGDGEITHGVMVRERSDRGNPEKGKLMGHYLTRLLRYVCRDSGDKNDS